MRYLERRIGDNYVHLIAIGAERYAVMEFCKQFAGFKHRSTIYHDNEEAFPGMAPDEVLAWMIHNWPDASTELTTENPDSVTKRFAGRAFDGRKH